MSDVVKLRATAEEQASWKAAAVAEGVTLSDWIRARLNGSGITVVPVRPSSPAAILSPIPPLAPFPVGGLRKRCKPHRLRPTAGCDSQCRNCLALNAPAVE